MNHLEAARRAADNANVIGRPNDPAQEIAYANMHAAVASAEALTRIAECLEVLVEERTASMMLVRLQAKLGSAKNEIDQLEVINRELGRDSERMEAKLRELGVDMHDVLAA